MPEPTNIAGLWCQDVLALLPDYLDGSLSQDQRTRVEEHLAGCDWCTRFGGEYAGTVQAVRQQLEDAPPPGLSARLLERLEQEG